MKSLPRGQIKSYVMDRIERSEPHSVFFISDFVDKGSSETIRKIFFQATEAGMLERVSQGIYVKPKESRFGRIPVSLEKLAVEIADRDKSRILPSGSTAANMLGLSTQIPMNMSYITTGSTRAIEVDGRRLFFRHAAPKNFAAKGNAVPLMVQGLKEIGENNISESQFAALKNFIDDTDDPYLSEDILLAPLWIQKIIRKLMQNNR